MAGKGWENDELVICQSVIDLMTRISQGYIVLRRRTKCVSQGSLRRLADPKVDVLVIILSIISDNYHNICDS